MRRAVRAASAGVLPLVCVLALSAPSQAAVPVPPDTAASRATEVPATDPHLGFEGHWGRVGSSMITNNTGSELRFRFTGRTLTGLFDVSSVTIPASVYVSVDGGTPTLYSVDRDRIDFTPQPLAAGTHTVEIAVKDVNENANRWVVPMQSGLVVTGLELDPGAHVRPAAPLGPLALEFIGDSITQGVDALCGTGGTQCVDGTKTYSYLTGKAFHADTAQVGFGRQGILVTGNGNVPTAPGTLGLNFQGSPENPHFHPDAIVVNQGTNDGIQGAGPFQPAYLAYLKQVRARYPHAWIFAMRPFQGYEADAIAQSVTDLNDPRTVYVDTTGWLSSGDYTDGVHPSVAAHARAAELLTAAITDATGWKTRATG
jgi:lysophospholipase L1-like esterase